MQITDVRVRKVTKEGKMKAVVSITIDNEFVVHEIKVKEKSDGELFIAMPSRQKNERRYDIAHPINQDVRDRITKAVLDKYDEIKDLEPAEPKTETESESDAE